MISGAAQVVRAPLTRNVEVRFPDVRDEIIAAFGDYIPVKSDGKYLLLSTSFGLMGTSMDQGRGLPNYNGCCL